MMDNTVASTIGMSVKGIRYLVESYGTIRQSNLTDKNKTSEGRKRKYTCMSVCVIRSNS